MVWQQIIRMARSSGRGLLDLALPPLCLRCDTVVTAAGSFCAACWQKLAFITAPHCPLCGVPYELERGDLPCPTCLTAPARYKQARAAVAYDEASRGLVLGFKHADQTHLADALARLMLQAGRGLLEDDVLLAPVPLHRWRIFRRCYNQSALLAERIGHKSQRRAVLDLLLRRRATQPQASLKAVARARNVRDAFAVNPRHAALVAGRVIVVVDDVLTTGATVDDCSRALLAAGAAEVRVLTFARTL